MLVMVWRDILKFHIPVWKSPLLAFQIPGKNIKSLKTYIYINNT